MPLPTIDPPLLNSSNPWATTLEDLQALFDCPHTGAVTTRTSLLQGFAHDDEIHQYAFFNPANHSLAPHDRRQSDDAVSSTYAASLNTLGYSPIPLAGYLAMIPRVVASSKLSDEHLKKRKSFIISVTGSAEAVRECYDCIQALQLETENPLCMEINLSCPNIPGKPPPAYSASALGEYLVLLSEIPSPERGTGRRVAIGIKTPPYTYHDEFRVLIDALLSSSSSSQSSACPIDFVSATNTLGSCLVLSGTDSAALNSASGTGIGGMAGAALHPLALGNVRTIRGMLDEHERLKGVDVIGIGGVGDHEGFERMRAVGAKAVGVGTALGREGVGVFGKILGRG